MGRPGDVVRERMSGARGERISAASIDSALVLRGVVHELRNLSSVLVLSAERLAVQRELAPSPVESIERTIGRLGSFAEDLAWLVGTQVVRPEPVALGALLAEIRAASFAPDAEAPACDRPEVVAYVDPIAARRLLALLDRLAAHGGAEGAASGVRVVPADPDARDGAPGGSTVVHLEVVVPELAAAWERRRWSERGGALEFATVVSIAERCGGSARFATSSRTPGAATADVLEIELPAATGEVHIAGAKR